MNSLSVMTARRIPTPSPIAAVGRASAEGALASAGWRATAAEETLSFSPRLASDVAKTGARSPARLFADPAEEGSDDAWPTIRLTASL